VNPVKLVIKNYPEGQEEWLEAENNPEDDSAGSRKVPFSRELYIEKEDFKEDASRKFFRLTLGKEVRLKNAYIIKGESVVKDDEGNIIEIHCTYDPESKSGSGTEASKRNVKGTLHWVSMAHAVPAEIRVYDRLFNDEAPAGHKDKDFMEFLNPESLKIITGYVEPSLKEMQPLEQFQFQRLGYFNVDPDSSADLLVFNKTVGLRDTWAKAKPVQSGNNNNKPAQNQQREVPAIEEVKRAGKKYTNLPEEKRTVLRNKIIEAAKKVEIDELIPLYNTAAKKVGTRIATTIALGIVLETKNMKPDELAIAFIQKGMEDGNELLQMEAKEIAKKYNIN